MVSQASDNSNTNTSAHDHTNGTTITWTFTFDQTLTQTFDPSTQQVNIVMQVCAYEWYDTNSN